MDDVPHTRRVGCRPLRQHRRVEAALLCSPAPPAAPSPTFLPPGWRDAPPGLHSEPKTQEVCGFLTDFRASEGLASPCIQVADVLQSRSSLVLLVELEMCWCHAERGSPGLGPGAAALIPPL